MKLFKKIIIITFLLIIYAYVCNISLLPSNYIIMQGENLRLYTLLGIRLIEESSYQTLQTSSTLEQEKINKIGKVSFRLNLFNLIPLKNIDVNVIPKTTVVPMGNAIGMKLYTAGVLVVGMSEIEGKKPYENSGIKEGDRIIQINQNQIDNTDDLMKAVNKSDGNNISIKYVRDEKTITTSIKPLKNSSNEYKIGLWVRDAAAGVGTLTFYEPTTGSFAALGHGIVDVDTGGILNIANGELVTSKLISIQKGEKNNPGEIKGSIDSGVTIGEIEKNTNFGVFGLVSNRGNLDLKKSKEYDVALRSEIKTGEAEIICELEEGKKETYKIEIEKIYTSNNYDNKSMLIKITDERLLEKTGGIIQGMSGAPIIQNGKFIGAITNVLVSDPMTGYAIFGDLMIKQMRTVQ